MKACHACSFELTTSAPSETQELGALLAAGLRAGDVLLLEGELGSGKTTFVQGIARGLGVKERITSPTFTLLREHHGRLSLVHLDAYRLEGPLDLFELGVEEYLEEDTALVVEWGDRVKGFFRPPYLEVRFEYAQDEKRRKIVFIPENGDWGERLTGLMQAYRAERDP